MATRITARKARTKKIVRKTVKMQPGRNGGLLQVGNPGNKGGGRPRDYFYERAALLAADPVVWDKQHADAKGGSLKPLVFAAESLGWAKRSGLLGAALETPDGIKFKLLLGEPSDADY